MPDHINRRNFVRLCGTGCALVASGCIAEVYGGNGDFSLADDEFESLREVGGTAPINVEDRAVLLIRVGDDEVVALSRICTHQQCDLSPAIAGQFDVDSGQLRCLCHDARYNTSGKVVGGPAPAPLERFTVDFDPVEGRGRVIL